MKDYIEERTTALAHYIIENNTTVRKTAGVFHVSKSTVHTVLSICVDLYDKLNIVIKSNGNC